MCKSNWIFERSSGYAGWRCTKCYTWVYDGEQLKYDCDESSNSS